MKKPVTLLFIFYAGALIIGMCVSTCFTGCINRKVALVKTDTRQTSDSVKVHSSSQVILDTSTASSSKTALILDTSNYTVEIIPDSGIVQVIKGDFKGHAQKIILSGGDQLSKYIASVTNLHKNVITDSAVKDSAAVIKTVQVSTKTKNTEATTSWKMVILIIVLAIIVVVAIYYYLRSAGLFTFGTIAGKLPK